PASRSRRESISSKWWWTASVWAAPVWPCCDRGKRERLDSTGAARPLGGTSPRSPMWRTRWCVAAGLAAGSILLGSARPARAEAADPLPALIQRSEAFLRRGEENGVTLDPRHFAFPELLRLTVVPQLAGFCELYRVAPTTSRLQDITDRASFLVRVGTGCRSFDAADGMLGYALLGAYATVGNPVYRDAAQPIVAWCLSAPADGDPNRALMAALCLAEYHRQTADPVARAKVG